MGGRRRSESQEGFVMLGARKTEETRRDACRERLAEIYLRDKKAVAMVDGERMSGMVGSWRTCCRKL